MYFQVIFILFGIKECFSTVPVNPKGFVPAVPNLRSNMELESVSNISTQSPGFRISLPFMDMNIESKRNIIIMQEKSKKQMIFALHGNELYEIIVERKEKRLSLVGYFGGVVKEIEPLGGEAIIWRDFIVFVIGMDDNLEVYQIPNRFLEMRSNMNKDEIRKNETSPILEPIQQLTHPGRYRQHFLTDPDENNIMLILGINFTKLYSRLHTFLWSNSYFEPIEELTIPPLHMLHVLGTYPKYIVRGRVIQHQTKTIIAVYKIQSPSMTLQNIQTFTANSRVIHASSFHGRNYLIACSIQQKQCNSFRMSSDGIFNVYKHRPSKDLAFDKFVGGTNFLVSARQNQVFVYTNGRLDCYASFVSNNTEVTSILTLVNTHGENFILLCYKRAFQTLVRFVELESEKGNLLGAAGLNVTETEDLNTVFHHRHMFEETIGMLRSLLLKRRNAMNTFRRISIARKTKPLELDISHPVHIQAGNIKVIKIVGQHLLSPMQLLHRVAQTRRKFGLLRGRRSIPKDMTLNITPVSYLKVKHLKVRNLIYTDSILKGFHLDKTAQPLPTLSVRPKLTTRTVITERLLNREKFNGYRVEETADNTALIPIKYRVLNVEMINNVSWIDFYDRLFLKNRDTKIQGNLVVQSSTNISNLTTIELNELIVENLFNLEQPQVIHSNILFSGFLIKEMYAENINGLDFANDIVFQSTDCLIETPVNMYKLSIAGDLLLDDNVTIARTNLEENSFQQYYTGRVVINGSLTIKNLRIEESGRVFVSELPFYKTYLMQKYILRNREQTFDSKVIFGNAKVTVPNLNTNLLNDNPTEEHLMADVSLQVKNPLLLVFLNSHIEGDLKSTTIVTRISNISRDAVRRGDVANIIGVKTFLAPLTIDHCMTLSLNHLPVSDLVLKSQLKRTFKFDGKKSFNSIWTKGDSFVHKELNLTNLNKLPVEDLLNNDHHIDKLKVPFKLEAKNIVFQKINGISFDKIFNNFKLRNGQLVLHKELIIDGNVRFIKDLFVEYINGINWNTYEADLVRSNDDAVIGGKKCFLNELTITEALKTSMLNDMNMEDIFSKVLSKSKPQIIEGEYTFENLQLTNLDVSVVNNIPTNEFINSRTKGLVVIEGDVIVPKITVIGDVSTSYNNDFLNLNSLSEGIKHLENRTARNIVVTGNAFWNQTENVGKAEQELLNYLQRNAVRKNGDQVISGNVKIIRPSIKNMKTKSTFPGTIDFDFLVRDGVFKKSNTTQVITTKKTFLKVLHLQNVESSLNVEAQLVNGIDILHLNASLYYLSNNDPIIGPLYFRTPPMIDRFFVEGRVNGMDPNLIYHNVLNSVPPIIIHEMFVEKELQIGDINDKNLNYLLKNRITKKSMESLEITGVLNFENLALNNEVFLQTLNGIPVDKLVFKKSDQLQAITGVKFFEGDLMLAGPAHIMYLNGEDLTESYKQSIFVNRNYHHGNIRVDDATFEKGFAHTHILNPLLGSNMEDTENSELTQKLLEMQRIEAIKFELQNIGEILHNTSHSSKSLLYLDYANNWNISWQTGNMSIHKNFTFKIRKPSLCERRYVNIEISNRKSEAAQDGIIILNNITTNLITAFAFNLSVKAENYCEHKYRKVKSKITITDANFTRIIGMKKYVENINIYSAGNMSKYPIFVLIHAIDLSRNQHEVRVLKFDKSQKDETIITDWQSLTTGIGKTLSLYQHPNYTALVSGGGILKYHPVLGIYHFDSNSQKFKLAQTIDGDFDIHELLSINDNKGLQLILSCIQCQRVYIYSYNPQRSKEPYQIFQIIKLKTLISRIHPFKTSNGSLYLLFLAEHGQHYYYLYRYSQLRGWLHATYGYFENTEMAFPLISDVLSFKDQNLLALLCSVNNCCLVRVVVA